MYYRKVYPDKWNKWSKEPYVWTNLGAKASAKGVLFTMSRVEMQARGFTASMALSELCKMIEKAGYTRHDGHAEQRYDDNSDGMTLIYYPSRRDILFKRFSNGYVPEWLRIKRLKRKDFNYD